MKTFLRGFVGAVAVAALLGPSGAQAQAPIKIGASLSLTGTYAKPGTYQKEGYEVCADELDAKRGLKTIAIVNEDTLFPKATVAGTAELAKKRGLQIVLQEAYPKGNTDFSALLVKIKAANPDVLAAATYFDDAVAITRQMKE